MKRDLYICHTPLQVVIAKKIIQSKMDATIKPDFVLIPLADTDRFRYYFQSISELCDESIYLNEIRTKRFPFYAHYIARRFRNKEYRCVYLANIDSAQIQLILSFIKFNEINTFDDGTANISKNGNYYKDEPGWTERLRRIARKIIGNRFSSEKIKQLSSKHYTIYPRFKNIIDNVVPIDLFSDKINPHVSVSNKRKCVVLLGTIYNQAFKNTKDKELLLSLLQKLINNSEADSIYYLPHPVDEADYFEGVIKYKSLKIAEEIILELKQQYEEIDLIGFANSTQFYLMNVKGIRNFVIKSKLLDNNRTVLAGELIKNNAEVIDIDR
jgi:beta-galactosamide-alpha-2,3-sialyltransferase